MVDSDKRRVVNKWVTDNYNQLRINLDKLATYSNPLKEDLFACTMEQFLEKDIDQLYNIITGVGQKPEHYFTRMMALNLKSNSSRFYQKYRKPTLAIREFHVNHRYEGQEYDYELEDTLEGDLFTDIPKRFTDVRKAMELLREDNFYYHDIILKLYVQGWGHDDYAEHYQIPIRELRANVTAARNRFKLFHKKLENGDIK